MIAASLEIPDEPFLILAIILASSVYLTSCSNDSDPLDELNKEQQTTTWTEPYHTMGASVSEVKTFMVNHQDYNLKSENRHYFTSDEKDVIINTEPSSGGYFNICYSFVSK